MKLTRPPLPALSLATLLTGLVLSLPGCGATVAGIAAAVSSSGSSGGSGASNSPPKVTLSDLAIFTNQDRSRGIPIPFTVDDDESEVVDVIFQWRLASEPEYVDLRPPAAQAAAIPLDQVGARQLRDHLRNADVEALQICTEIPLAFKGMVSLRPGSTDTVRLPELAGSAAVLVERLSDGRGRVTGSLELLRESNIPAPITSTWTGGGVESPVACLPEGDGTLALVLESRGRIWRLRRLLLATGQDSSPDRRDLGTLASGNGRATALAVESSGETALVALTFDEARWEIRRVELAPSTQEGDLVLASDQDDGSARPLVVRDLLSTSDGAVFLTVQSSVVRLVMAPGHAPRLVPILSPQAGFLGTPWGIVSHPARPGTVLIADTGGDRLLEIDPLNRELRVVNLAQPVRRPRTLAAPGSSSDILVQGEDEAGVPALFRVNLGSGQLSTLVPPGTGFLSGLEGGIATGRDGLVIACLTSLDELAVGGGVEQVHRIRDEALDYDPGRQSIRVEGGFEPALRPSQPWRIRRTVTRLTATPEGTRRTFLWDSQDVGGQASVFLRAIALDSVAVGSAGDTASSGLPKEIGSTSPEDFEAISGLAASGVATCGFADMDSDGIADLVASHGASNTIRFFRGSRGLKQEFPPLLLDSAPTHVATGDLDGDGRIDVVVCLEALDRIDVFFNESFDETETRFDSVELALDPSSGPSFVSVADLDADGLLDLVSASTRSSRIGVHHQRPGRQFEQTESLGDPVATREPVWIQAADIDLDGRIDLAVASRGAFDPGPPPSLVSGLVTIFWQSARGSYSDALRTDLRPGAAGSSPESLAVVSSDVDLDGDPDLIVAEGRSDRLHLFLQEDSREFRSGPELTLGAPERMLQPVSLTILDFDGDSIPDVLSTNSRSNNIACFSGSRILGILRTPNSLESLSPRLLGSPAVTPTALFLAGQDVNGDGRTDLAIVNGAGNNALTVLRQPQVRFSGSPSTVLRSQASIDTPECLAAADLDGDGDLDMLSANSASRNAAIFFQVSPRLFLPAPTTLEGIDRPAAALALDLDGDALLDLATANTGSSDLAVFLQRSSGVFDSRTLLGDPEITRSPVALVAGDIDGNSLPDLISANSAGNDLTIFWQETPGTFSPDPRVLADSRLQVPFVVRIGDVNLDGHLDVVAGYRGDLGDGRGIGIFIRDGTSPRSLLDPLILEDGFEVQDLAVADIDRDGLPDIAVAGRGIPLRVLFQSPDRDLTFRAAPLDRCGCLQNDVESIALCDVDDDGDLDIVGTDSIDRKVVVLLQTLRGVFDEMPPQSMNLAPRFLTASDVDGDGDLDLLLALGDTLQVLYGDR